VYVAVCCSVLQCVAVCCSVNRMFQCEQEGAVIVIPRNQLDNSFPCMLQCVPLCCSVLQCDAECCSVLQCELEGAVIGIPRNLVGQ